MIKITSLNKIYKSKKRKKCHALNDINLTLPDAGLVFVLGKSGSGKSTLLNLIGGLDSITSGSIEVDGNDLAKFKEKDFCNYRNSHIGFIFQDYHLIDELTVYENIRLSLDLENRNEYHLIGEALAKVDLAGYEERYPTELSGGEQQRVAIARAIVKKPRIILADEPTGNLDTNTAKQIVELLKELSRDCLVLIVSHNINDANNYADRIIELKKGRVISDKSRNPEFLDEVSLQNGELVYPQGLALSDNDIDFINNNLTKFKKKTDKFLPTAELKSEARKVKILNKKLALGRELNLSGKFLKSKTLAISFSAFMVAVIMVIMALAQTIINFDSGRIIKEEMDKYNSDSIYYSKLLNDEQKAMLAKNERVSDCYPEIYPSEIQKIKDAGYTGKIYEVLKYDIHISLSSVSAGISRTFFSKPPYVLESIGTIIVDEEFLERKFGEIKYLAKAEEFHPTGVIITDYIADAIMLCGRVPYAVSYESLIGEYHWNGGGTMYSCVSRGYINGIIYTGYKVKYAEMFDLIAKGELESYADIKENEKFAKFIEEVYSGLAFCYTTNPNFKEDALTNPSWEMLWHYTLSFDDGKTYYAHTGPQIRKGSFYGVELGSYDVIMNRDTYNEFFGTDYQKSDIEKFEPHKVTVSHYKHFDQDNPLFTKELNIVGLFENNTNNMGGTFIVGEGVWDLFAKDYIYTTGLLLEGNENLDTVIDVANDMGFQQHIGVVEGIHTMTKAVDVFIPIFELIAIFLCVGVIFILVNFSSKMINDKMHEIGILKAIGAKNYSIGIIFGIQVILIALLTCIISALGYLFFIDLANDVLIASIRTMAPGWVMPNLQFLIFEPSIVLTNCILTFILAVVSLIIPMIKIRAIKPVKIIKVKE